jgi:hypothetical protein
MYYSNLFLAEKCHVAESSNANGQNTLSKPYKKLLPTSYSANFYRVRKASFIDKGKKFSTRPRTLLRLRRDTIAHSQPNLAHAIAQNRKLREKVRVACIVKE